MHHGGRGGLQSCWPQICYVRMSYIGELRLRHIGHDFPVGLALGRVFAKVRASLDRGKGPPSRAPETLFFELVWETNEAQEVLVVGAADAFVVACAWRLREKELAAVRLTSAEVILREGGDVTLRLPWSRTDQQAKSVARRLSHSCWKESFDGIAPSTYVWAAVVALSVGRLIRRLRHRWGAELLDVADELLVRCLFPASDGSQASLYAMVSAWGMAAPRAIRPPSGHSARRSGAKRYAKAGFKSLDDPIPRGVGNHSRAGLCGGGPGRDHW